MSCFFSGVRRNRTAITLGLLLGLTTFSTQSYATVLGANWIGGFGTAWTNGSNWGFADPDQFPRNGHPAPLPGQDPFEYNIDIQSGGPVDLDQGTAVLNVTIGTGQTLTLKFNSDNNTTGSLTLDRDGINGNPDSGGLLANNGFIVLDQNGSDGLNRTLRIRDGDLVITGTGTIDMRDSAQNRILGGASAGTVTHGAGHTIQGAGVVGNNGFGLENEGAIEATQGNNALVLNARGDQNTNSGVIGARNGGTMRIDGTILDNNGGVIQALSNSTVELRSQNSTSDPEGTRIVGGTLRTESNGLITTVSNSATIEGLAIETGSEVRVADGTSLRARETITNNGRVTIDDRGGSTTLTIGSEPTVFTGSGEILMRSDDPAEATRARVRGQTSGDDQPAPDNATLVNESNHRIRGAGDLGLNTLFLDNRGLILADQSGKALTINTKGIGTGSFNTGTMRAAGGGVLEIQGSVIDNTGGVIEAFGGSTVELDRRNAAGEVSETRIIGGTLAGSGDGLFRTSSIVTLADTTLAAGTEFHVENGSQLILSGSATNNGTVTTRADGALTQVQIFGDTAIQGNGTIVMETNRSRIRSASGDDGALLTNGAGHTIRGEGTLGFSTISIDNQGTIIADGDAALIIDPTNGAGGRFTNTGHLIAQGAGGMSIVQAGSAFETSGTVDVENGSILDVTGIYRQTGGETNLVGNGAELEATTVLLEGGSIGGTGTIDANLINSGGTVGPGLSPGILSVDGNFEQTDDGTFLVEIFNDAQFDQMFATGEGRLAGTLEIDLFAGAAFENGDVFSIMHFNDNARQSRFGEFDRISGSGSSFFDIVYGLDGITLIANRSFDGTASVPEPDSLALMVFGLVATIAIRRRQSKAQAR